MENSYNKAEIGVIIGRFQVPVLHEAHKDLIRTVISRHPKVLILIGNSPTLVTYQNPFDYQTRQLMLSKDPEFGDKLTILPIKDMGSDIQWSKAVDSRIREIYPMGEVILYGSRDDFIPHYFGEFKTQELDSTYPQMSGSEIRKKASQTVKESEDFRLGVIYAAFNKHPIVYPTVDVAIVDKTRLLLARKRTDEPGKYRFVGGFIQKGETAEEGAKREAGEEVKGVSLDSFEYIGTSPIDDWRYRNTENSILTTLFYAQYIYGKPEPADDIDELKWFEIPELEKSKGFIFVAEHKCLWEMFIKKSHLKKEN